MKSTSVYRAIMVELERKRLAMGMSMERLSEIVGAERSWSKMLYPDTSSGRQASWDKLQRAVDALFADGFEVVVRHGAGLTSTTPGTKRLIRQAAAHYDRRTQRDLMREIGIKGAAAYLDKVPEKHRIRYARAAARAGNAKRTAKERKALAKRAADIRWIEQRAKQIGEKLTCE